MKVLFINAINPIVEVEQRYPNLGIGYLISSLRKHFGENVFDFRVADKNIKDELLRFNPDIACITSVSQNFNLAKECAKFAKTKNIPVIIGGIHISMLPDSLSDDMDVGCIREGEKTIIELFELFLENKGFPREKLEKIKGVCYKKNKRVVLTEPRELIDNLDSIPFPARDLLKIEKHSYLFSSRGCPYRCVFCASSRYWKNVRLFSAEYVVREIKELVERYNVRLISFFDDLFIIDRERIKKITELLKKEKFHKKVRFTCSCRANLLDDDMARLLKEMGVISVGMGLESGNERILRYLKGQNINIKDNIEAVRVLKKYGISADASFIIGSPDETKEEILDTYKFIKNNPLDLVDIYVLTPFPGTQTWDYAKERKLVFDDMDWSRLNINFDRNNYKKAIILSEVLDREEIWRLYQKFQRQRLIRNLKSIWRHPYLQDVPKVFLKALIQKIRTIFSWT